MTKIESIYLNEDEEQKVSNIINLAEKFGFKVDFGRVQIPKGLGSIRVVIEAKTARDYLEFLQGVEFFNEKEDDLVDITINQFNEVLRKELRQIRTGKQKAVAERDEATQE